MGDLDVVEGDQQQRSNKQSAPDNLVVINFQIIINGMDIAKESLQKYSEFLNRVTDYNLKTMKSLWNPFFTTFYYPGLEDKK
jgi:hypothetical protein